MTKIFSSSSGPGSATSTAAAVHHAPIRLCLHGSEGRMGTMIQALAQRDPRFAIIALIDQQQAMVPDIPVENAFDVLIDFSSDGGAAMAAEVATRCSAALLVGTTGLSPETRAAVARAGDSIPVLVAPNTSLGVAVLAHLGARAARLLGPEFSIDIIESHHAMKKDAPSGTALRLAEAMRDAGGAIGGARIHALRAGDIVGEHEIRFAGPGETLSLSHRATSRELFARGALLAARYLAGKPPGRYTIEQALGIPHSLA